MTEHAVVIAGGGPTGLMLAAELALAGVDVAIVERRASQDLPGLRAGSLHSRTIEVLDQRGTADRFLSQGQVAQVAQFAGIPLDISDFPTRHNHGLGLWQNHIERILAGWVGELRMPIYYGSEVTGFAQDDTSVDVELSDGPSLRVEYLVGCDGGRSLIQKAAGIEFPGWGPTTSHLIAEVEMAEEPEWGLRRDVLGIHSLSRMGDGGPVRRCDILSRTHKGGSGWAATCWVSRRSTKRRSRSLAARARTWGSFRGSKASACRLAFA
jgi:2-polyprenyl-6-methoxyphenol hydroxylase-like FAD-dependent oxidoreductase